MKKWEYGVVRTDTIFLLRDVLDATKDGGRIVSVIPTEDLRMNGHRELVLLLENCVPESPVDAAPEPAPRCDCGHWYHWHALEDGGRCPPKRGWSWPRACSARGCDCLEYKEPAPPSPKVEAWWDAAFKALGKDILDRGGLKWEWEKIDDEIKQQISAAWYAIVCRHTPAPNLDEMARRAAEAVWEHHNGKPPSAVEQAGIGFARLTASIRKALQGE